LLPARHSNRCFVNDIIGAAQGPTARLTRVRRILLTAADSSCTNRPVDPGDSIFRNEPSSSVKKMLQQGDANKNLLATPTIELQRMADILSENPSSQKRTSLKRWHQILGELQSMALAIPDA
jgi:hypothetical protein